MEGGGDVNSATVIKGIHWKVFGKKHAGMVMRR